MATIANLAVKLSATTQDFVGGINRAAKATEGLQKTVNGLASVAVSGLGIALAGAGVKSLKDFITAGFDAVIATNKLSRELGATTEGVATLQHAMALAGGDTADVGSGLKALNDALTTATTGGSATADSFSRLGLSAADLAKIPVDQAFLKVASAIRGAGDAGKRAAAATAIFGDKAAALLPILNQGKGGLEKAAEEAKRLGLSFSAIDGGQVEAVSQQFDRLSEVIKGVSVRLAVELSPYILAAANELERMAETGKGTGGAVTSAFESITQSVVSATSISKIFSGSADAIRAAFVKLAYYVTYSLQQMLEVAAKLPDSIGGEWARDAAKSVAVYSQALNDVSAEYERNANAAFKSIGASQEVADTFDRIRKNAAQTAKTLNDTRGAAGAVSEVNKKLKLFEQGKSAFEAVRSPLQKFRDEMAKLNALITDGAVSWDTYALSSTKALSDLESVSQASAVKLPGSATRDTQAGASAVIQGLAQDQMTNRENPQQRVARIMEQALAIEKEHLAASKQIADILKRQQQPETAKF